MVNNLVGWEAAERKRKGRNHSFSSSGNAVVEGEEGRDFVSFPQQLVAPRGDLVHTASVILEVVKEGCRKGKMERIYVSLYLQIMGSIPFSL